MSNLKNAKYNPEDHVESRKGPIIIGSLILILSLENIHDQVVGFTRHTVQLGTCKVIT